MNELTPNIVAYRDLESRLADVREGCDSEEEDALLSEGDSLWGDCDAAERAYLNTNHGPYYERLVKWC